MTFEKQGGVEQSPIWKETGSPTAQKNPSHRRSQVLLDPFQANRKQAGHRSLPRMTRRDSPAIRQKNGGPVTGIFDRKRKCGVSSREIEIFEGCMKKAA